MRDTSCGQGKQKQRRECSDGAINKCTASDRERFVPCNLPDCPKKLGPWKDDGSCNVVGKDKNCGKGLQQQTRSCTDGTTDKCSEADKIRTNPCFLKDCEKEIGIWENRGECEPTGKHGNCGPGNQQQIRHCKDGTVDKCSDEDMARTIPCSLPDCTKDLGQWENDGECQSVEPGKDCGEGYQLQTRICKDGTDDKCSAADTKRQIPCQLPKCPSKNRTRAPNHTNTLLLLQLIADQTQKNCRWYLIHKLSYISVNDTSKWSVLE